MFRYSLVLLAPLVCCAIAPPEQPLSTLRAQHPRLIATDADIARVRATIKSDPFAAEMAARLKRQADTILTQTPVVHRLIGPRLLDQSRLALDRIYTLALVYRLDGGKQYLDRAVKEMRTAAEFPDWNPSHFLDVAEMTHALAIGYDWLYPALSAEDRALIRRAIVEKGIDQALPIYKENRWWAKVTHNWNQVCNGGMAIGALAVAEDEREKSTYVLKRSVESIQLAMNSYAPEGGWNEGPGYWHYATRYNVYYLAALESALGTDFGLSGIKGFAEAGTFRIYFQGPSGGTFNYADAHHGVESAEEMYWLARHFKQPAFAYDETRLVKARMRPHALDLVWYTPEAQSPKAAGWPVSRMFAGADVAFLRSDWEDAGATWLGIKGGDNKANHSHLDLGGFVLDAGGVRWATDLGSDNYNMPAYFGNMRWTYFRLRTESHNTLLIDGENQDPKAAAPMTMKGGDVTIDLSKAYGKRLTRWVRTAKLSDGTKVVIRDEIEAPQPVEAIWNMTTEAEVAVKGARAELTRDGKSMAAEIVSPAGAVFQVTSAQPPEPQNQNRGARRLQVKLPAKVTAAHIEVVFSPQQKK